MYSESEKGTGDAVRLLCDMAILWQSTCSVDLVKTVSEARRSREDGKRENTVP